MWASWSPDLIWMDMRMPVMDGYEATRRIKGTDQGKGTVVIALTASAFEENRKQVLSAGCDGFIRKPFREEEVFEALSHHLGVRFVYGSEPVFVSSGSAPVKALSSDALSSLSGEWVDALHQAAMEADAEAINGLLKEIEGGYGELSRALGELVRDFRFDEIMAFSTAKKG